MALNRKAFFDAVRASFGALNQKQVDGFNAVLIQWEHSGVSDDRHLAYMLATAWHETGRAMQPVVENLNYTSAARIRQVWPSRFPTEASAQPFVKNPRDLANRVYGGRMGNVGADDGWTYRGRGFVQITGRDNYDRVGKLLGLDLLRNPDLARQSDIAAAILQFGMEEGWFTDRKLKDFEGSGKEFDAKGARRIINGLDEADRIAGYYRQFLRAVLAGQSPALPDKKPESVEIPPPPDIEPIPMSPVGDGTDPRPAHSGGLFAALKALLVALFGRK